MAATGKKVAMFFDKIVDTYENQSSLLSKVSYFHPDDADMQNSGDVAWQSVKQHAPIIDGFNVTGLATDIIQETVPMALGVPKNDIVEQEVRDLRDPQFWDNRAEVSGKRQVAELNKRISNIIANAGSLYFDTPAVNGFNALGQAQAILDERQKGEVDRFAMLNPRDNLKYSQDLAGRQTFAGRPENAYGKGVIGAEVANFLAYSGSFLPTLTGNAAADAVTTAALSDKPEGGAVNTATNTVTNVDYRVSTIAIVSANYAVGDRVKFTLATGADVQSLGLQDKTETGQAMTAVITAIPDGASIQVYPKIIAANDAALSVIEKAYANVDTQVIVGTTVTKLNTFAGTKSTNLFWCKDAVQVTGGNAPLNLLSEYGGMKLVSTTMENGQIMYMVYDGNIETLKFKMRVFTWYGETMLDPSACGIFTTS